MFKIGCFISRLLSAGSYPPRPWRFRIAAALVLLGLLFPVSQYLQLVLRNPQRTGLLIIGSNYEAPWDINPWYGENLAALEKLDKHNLSVKRLSDPSLLAFGQWAELCDDVEHLVESTNPAHPLIVYINLHGVTSRDGQPCLLTCDSQPLDPSTWLPLNSLIQRIRQAMSRERPLVVAIEGGRQHGLPLPADPEQTFADAVRRWYATLEKSGQTRGLALIVSSTSRFGSVLHTAQPGDLFTHCLTEALSGRCDQVAFGGNADQRIEWAELQRYVHDQVEQRSKQVRGVPQLTEGFTSENAAQFLAWNTALDLTMAASAHPVKPESEALEALTAIWKQIYSLQSLQPWREDPHAWGRLKRTMVAWEQSIFGGSDARSRSSLFEKSATELVKQIDSMVSQRDQDAGLEARLCKQSMKRWQQIVASPTLMTAREVVAECVRTTHDEQVGAVPLLVEMLDQPELPIWSQPERLRQLATLKLSIEQSRLIQTQLPALPDLINVEHQIDEQRRQLEDMTCVGTLDNNWDRCIQSLEKAVNVWNTKLEQVRAAVEFNERMLARLPALCGLIDLLDEPSRSDTLLSEQLDSLDQAITLNLNRLTDAMFGKDSIADLVVAEAESQALFSQLALRWQRTLLEATSDLPPHVMTLEAFLASGMLPIEIGSIDKAVQLRLTTCKRLAELDAASIASNRTERRYDFGVRNEQRLTRWLDWQSEDKPGQSDDSTKPSQLWLTVHTTRIHACFGLGVAPKQTLNVWQRMQSRLRVHEATQRVLNDFWKLPKLNGQDYYAAIATKLMRELPDRARSELDRLMQSKMQSAANGLRLECECAPVWNEQAPQVMSCRISKLEPSLPGGIALLQIVERGTDKRLSLPVSIAIASDDQSSEYRLSVQTRDTHSASSAVAVAKFRGHRFKGNFDVRPRVGSAVVGTTAAPGAASIYVQTTARKQRARMLVLDCSASMHQPQPIEGVSNSGNSGESPSRLDAARIALNSILDHWRGQPDHVGVVLYGHRVAMGTPEQGKLLQTRYRKRYPFAHDIEAFEDVETILAPGRFEDQEHSEVQQRLQSIVPWGQTPLYLAVIQAAEELARSRAVSDSGTQSRPDLDVIVVSDGRNYQFNPTPDKNISLEQVIEHARNLGVRVHIIGFGIAASEMEQATSEFSQLAQRTGGSVCMEVQTAMQLIEHIDSLTEPAAFRVRLPDGQWIDSRCGETVQVPNIAQANTPVLVDYQGTQTLVPVSPQAAMRLTPGTNNRLVSAQQLFQAGARATISTSEGQASPFDLVLNVPTSNSLGTLWQLGLERRDASVAQRPKYIWIELQPKVSAERAGATTYATCDSFWQPQTTQPVLQFETQDWPDDCTSGSLRFWCSDRLPTPLARFHCTQAELKDHWLADESHVGTGSVRYQLQSDTDGVTLILLHAQPSDVLELMPHLENLPEGARVERRYCPAQRISIHRFKHPSLLTQVGLEVAIYSVSAFKSHALRSMTAIEVHLQNHPASIAVGNERTLLR